MGCWWERRHHEWKTDIFNVHTEIAEKGKKKHNIALVIDKDIQFQYQQRADRHDNVICWIFNSNVCLLLRSTSVQLVCFSSGPNHRCDDFIHLSSNLAHLGQFTSTRLWEGDRSNHRRSVLKNRHVQKEPKRTASCSSTPILPFFQTRARAAALFPHDGMIETPQLAGTRMRQACLSQQNHKCKLLRRSNQGRHNVFHLSLHGRLSQTLLHHRWRHTSTLLQTKDRFK